MRVGPSALLIVALAVSVAPGLCSPPPAWALVQETQSQPVPMPLQVQVMPTPTGPVVTWPPWGTVPRARSPAPSPARGSRSRAPSELGSRRQRAAQQVSGPGY